MLFFHIFIIFLAFYIMAKIVDEPFIGSLDQIADKFKIPPSVAGATFMAIGTSAPEISTSLIALFRPGVPPNPAIGLGTTIGSAIFQILVVIGFAAAVKACTLDWKPVMRDSVFYGFSVFLLIVLIWDGVLTSSETGLLIMLYFIYLFFLLFWAKNVKENSPNKDEDVIDTLEKEIQKGEKSKNIIVRVYRKVTKPLDTLLNQIPNPEKRPSTAFPVFFLSLFIIGVLCYFMVDSSEKIALMIGIPDSIIALTILAGGSSVPEMIGSAVLAKQNRGDMAVSNAIGSNIFDILISLGLPLFIYTATVGIITNATAGGIKTSLLVLIGSLIGVVGFLWFNKFVATKKLGYILISTYIIYVIAAYAGYL